VRGFINTEAVKFANVAIAAAAEAQTTNFLVLVLGWTLTMLVQK
jgi:hypothetical protein